MAARKLEGEQVVVVGLGKSGVAAARLSARLGAQVTATDDKAREALSQEALALESEGIRVVAGVSPLPLEGATLIVISPGVPSFPALVAAEARGVRVVGEVELATAQLRAGTPLVAIGGTNGKSTVTSLVGALLDAAGQRTFVGGNLGDPLAARLAEHPEEPFDAVVLEVSSFQMERLEAFHPRVAVLLNVTEDHLDRYPDLAAYAHAKGNAFQRQTAGDVAVVPFGDALCLAQARRGQGRVVTFGAGGDVDVTAEAVIDRASGAVYARKGFSLRGGHNASNVAAAVAVVRELGVPADTVRDVLRTFHPLPHRMTFVADVRGVRYYDDSKGTNVGAVVTALRGLEEGRAVLIAGGKGKDGSYAPLAEVLKTKGRAVVVIGEAAEEIAKAVGPVNEVLRATTMDDAVKKAASLARPGDAVLLSPACASFDMFRDYKHRGDVFVQAVQALRDAEGHR